MLIRPESKKSVGRWPVPVLSATIAASLLVLLDSVAILGTGFLTYDIIVVYTLSQNLHYSAIIFVWLGSLILMSFGHLYRFGAAIAPSYHLQGVLVAIASTFLFLLAGAFAIKPDEMLSRLWLASFAFASIASTVALRLAFSVLLQRVLRVDGLLRRVAVVGSGKQLRQFQSVLAESHIHPYKLHDLFNAPEDLSDGDPPSTNEFDRLMGDARLGLIDDIVIALPWSEHERIISLVAKLRELPVHVYLASDLIGMRTQVRPPPSHYEGLPIHEVLTKPVSGWDSFIKASEDYVLAAIILVMISPLLVAIAIAVKLDSKGPIFFKQKRLGYNNQVFEVFKFRSMTHEAAPTSTTVQAKPDDPRVTRLGRHLRRLSLDELPQIFNVLNGTMSLVGPRPHALDHNEEFAKRMDGYFARHRVKPGITGLAQVRGFRGGTDTPESLEGRVRNDVYYAENWSLSLDLAILARTILVVFSGRNAY